MGFKIDLVLENSCKNSNTEIHKTDLKFWVMPAAREIFFRGYFFVFLCMGKTNKILHSSMYLVFALQT